jgi:hypothetical protein
MFTAIDGVVVLHSMTHDAATTMRALGSKGVNSAFKGIERVLDIVHRDCKSLVIIVVTYFTLRHESFLHHKTEEIEATPPD